MHWEWFYLYKFGYVVVLSLWGELLVLNHMI